MQIAAQHVHRVVPWYSKLVTTSNLSAHANICTGVAHALGYDLALLCAHFHSICPFSVYEPVGVVLNFSIAATHKIDVVGES